jgi:hypothetical protein
MLENQLRTVWNRRVTLGGSDRVAGMVVSAQGQILRASLDTAVNTAQRLRRRSRIMNTNG